MPTDLKRPTRAELSAVFPDQRMVRAFEKIFDILPSDLLILSEAINDNLAIASSAESKATAILSDIKKNRPTGITFVSNLRNLPPSIGGVIILKANHAYYFTTTVDLLGTRLVGSQNTTIIGSSSESSKILSTGLIGGTALVSSKWTMPIRHISFEAATIFDLDASANAGQALDWRGVNFLNSSDIGTIKGYNNVVASSMAFLSSSGLVLDGNMGTVAITESFFSNTTSGTVIYLSATLSISRRVRIGYSSFVLGGTAIGVDASTSATIPVEGYIFDTCNFNGGTAIAGITSSDNRSRFINNKGIDNTYSITNFYMEGNATDTVITTANTPVKVAGTTIVGAISQRFDNTTSNKSIFEGAISRVFKTVCVVSLSAGNNQEIEIVITKNGSPISGGSSKVTTNSGGRAENGMSQTTVELDETDYIEIFVSNISNTTDILVEDLNVIIEAMN